MKQLKSQLEATGNEFEREYNDPNQGKDEEELKRRAREIETYRQQVKEEIETALNQSPTITNDDLESSNRNWQEQIWNTIIATGEKEIAQIRTRVLTDIRSKRAAKTGEKPVVTENSELAIAKRDAIHDIDIARNAAGLDNNDLDELNRDWREKIMAADNENTINLIKAKVLADIRNHREQKVDEQKEAGKALATKIRQATAAEIANLSDEELQEAMELFTRWEGESDYQESPENLKQIEERLMRENFELYKATITKAVKERMDDYGLAKEELSADVQVLVNGEITTPEELVAAKLRAIKEIGDLGAKSKWRNLFSSIKDYLRKAKNDFGSHLEEQLKIIKKQLTEVKKKATSNSYLTKEYQANEAEFSKLEKDLETFSQPKNETATDNPVPKGVIIGGVAIASGLVILGAIALTKKKKKG